MEGLLELVHFSILNSLIGFSFPRHTNIWVGGKVLWKITPLFAEWISSTTKNPFWTGSHQILNSSATVIELGCGISGLVALTLAPLVGKYIATDQEYVRKYFGKNIDENWHAASSSSSSPSGGGGGKANTASSKKGGRHSKSRTTSTENVRDNGNGKGGSINNTNVKFVPLDWELDIPGDDTLQGEEETSTTTTSNKTSGFDVLVSCDCIYNEALIPSFVRTCAEICTLRSSASSTSHSRHDKERKETGAINPTLVIVAQQQRAPDVFEEWLIETLRYFRVWRIGDFKSDHEGKKIDLGDGSGYVVHVLVLRSEFSDI